jgi:hypothetical protein
VRRVEAARQELEEIQSEAKEPSQARVSLTDPEARVMKHAGGDYAPSYNVQISTDAAQKVIVGVEVGQNASDAVLLKPALQSIERRLGQLLRQLVADGGYATKSNIADLAARDIDFYAPIPKADKNPGTLRQCGVTPAFFPEQFRYDAGGDQFLCPAGKVLHHSTQQERGHSVLHVYRARAADCRGCADRAQCTPRYPSRCVLRIVEQEAITVFRQKMGTDQAKADLPQAFGSGRVPQRLDQGQNQAAAVLRTRAGQSPPTGVMGRPDVQHSAVYPPGVATPICRRIAAKRWLGDRRAQAAMRYTPHRSLRALAHRSRAHLFTASGPALQNTRALPRVQTLAASSVSPQRVQALAVQVIRLSRQVSGQRMDPVGHFCFECFDVFREAQPGSLRQIAEDLPEVGCLARLDHAEIQGVGQSAAEPDNG